jgi:hypothetical protein
MKKIITAAVLSGLMSFMVRDELTGRWKSKPSETGMVTGIFFKPDNSFEGYVNAKPFVTGTYQLLADGSFSFVDNGCNGARGTYKLVFFSNNDSLRFEPISDSCAERKNGMSKLIVGRIK